MLFNRESERLVLCTSTTHDVQEYNLYVADKEALKVGDDATAKHYFRLLRLARRSKLNKPEAFNTCLVSSEHFIDADAGMADDAQILRAIQVLEDDLITRRGIIERVNRLVVRNENEYMENARTHKFDQLTDLVNFAQGCADILKE